MSAFDGMTFAQCVDAVAQQLNDAQLYFGHGTDNALDEAVWLVCYGLGLSEFDIEAHAHISMTSAQCTQVQKWLKQRIELRKPTAYILGTAWFCGLEFIVNESVLIPRSPIAELIYAQFHGWLTESANPTLLDLCCGSGCIGLATAAYLPDSHVDLADISEDALAVAQRNQAHSDLLDRTTLIQSDLFDAIPKQHQYDLIVSNPPYVDAEDMASMPVEFHHEPRLGLEAGDDGLLLLKRILYEATHYLADEGVLIVEVGNSAVHVEALYPNVPFTWIEFEHGGTGVFALSHASIKQHLATFAAEI
ncbi:MAG: 50S ribosomal protein L3 N(5)-glutamine methyltransferase [Pseudomonadota bacterium]